MKQNRCHGYNKNGKKCHTRLNNHSYFCCENHKPKNFDEMGECMICCKELTFDDIKILKCGHAHHIECLLNWMFINNGSTCPLCRKAINWLKNVK